MRRMTLLLIIILSHNCLAQTLGLSFGAYTSDNQSQGEQLTGSTVTFDLHFILVNQNQLLRQGQASTPGKVSGVFGHVNDKFTLALAVGLFLIGSLIYVGALLLSSQMEFGVLCSYSPWEELARYHRLDGGLSFRFLMSKHLYIGGAILASRIISHGQRVDKGRGGFSRRMTIGVRQNKSDGIFFQLHRENLNLEPNEILIDQQDPMRHPAESSLRWMGEAGYAYQF